MRRSVADRRLHGASPSIGFHNLVPDESGASIRQKGTHRRGVLSTLPIPEVAAPIDRLRRVERRRQFAPVTFITQERNSARDQASGVGVGSGSDGGAATRERGRRCLAFLGSEAPSFTTSDFDRERVVRVGSGAASTSPSTCSAAVSAGLGAGASSVFGFRPRPSCFARVDRCSE
jgi:hypothetical protein